MPNVNDYITRLRALLFGSKGSLGVQEIQKLKPSRLCEQCHACGGMPTP